MKKIVSLLLVIAMMTIFTACGGNSKAVKENITGKTWFFNGGSDLVTNRITFSEKDAVIVQTESTGNGPLKKSENTYKYAIKDNVIEVTLADGSTLEIPFTLEGEDFELGGADYQTAEEVAKGLNGVWTYRDNGSFLGFSMKNEHNVKIDGSNITYEHASEALGYPGEYYYYGPEKGTIKITDTGLDTNVDDINEFGFNIIKGKAVFIRYTDVFKPGKTLPGRYGYNF